MPASRAEHRPCGLPSTWAARVAVVLLCLAAACAALVLTPERAVAHPLSTTAVLLDVGPGEVTGQVQLPIDRLSIAVSQPDLTTAAASWPAKTEELRRYVAQHLAVTDRTGGQAWLVSVTGGRIVSIDAVDHLVFDLTFTPPDGDVDDFDLHYDAIVQRLVSHQVFVSARAAGSDAYTAVGVIDWQSHDLTVPVQGATRQQGFLAAVGLGVHHIAGGSDHLLFLLTLLLPAPLLARRGRWVRTDNLRRQGWRVVHVVTAFAVGHSTTLALAAFGLVSAPTRVVEIMIALSILVSGVHAIRPIVRGGEVGIAAGFGLMHGLAFATLLGQLDLRRSSLLTELLGFNLGIEVTQLIVVALVMPSLMVLSRTQLYPAVRAALAGLAVVLAACWLAERTTLISANPLEPVAEALVSHPLLVAGTLAGAAVLAWAVPDLRTPRTLLP